MSAVTKIETGIENFVLWWCLISHLGFWALLAFKLYIQGWTWLVASDSGLIILAIFSFYTMILMWGAGMSPHAGTKDVREKLDRVERNLEEQLGALRRENEILMRVIESAVEDVDRKVSRQAAAS